MGGVSSKAAGKLENKNKFNGNKLESGEFSDGTGLEAYDANFRQRDVQTGLWWQLDPMMEAHPNISPYAFVNNNPILYADPLGLDTVKVYGAGSHKIQIRPGDVLSMTIQNTTSYYTYDPNNKDAVNGFVGAGIEQDDSRSGESDVTVIADKKAKGIDYNGIGMAGLGMGIEYTGGKMFSRAAKTWFDTKQWKTYGQKFYGNQHTIRQATARRASIGFKYLGYGIGLLQESGIVFNNQLSTRDKIIESGSNLYSTFGGLYGAAWGIGWESGRMITQSDWYNTVVRPKLQDAYRKMGVDIEGDPNRTWLDKLPLK
jgi:RHS repeat-associated protein